MLAVTPYYTEKSKTKNNTRLTDGSVKIEIKKNEFQNRIALWTLIPKDYKDLKNVLYHDDMFECLI